MVECVSTNHIEPRYIGFWQLQWQTNIKPKRTPRIATLHLQEEKKHLEPHSLVISPHGKEFTNVGTRYSVWFGGPSSYVIIKRELAVSVCFIPQDNAIFWSICKHLFANGPKKCIILRNKTYWDCQLPFDNDIASSWSEFFTTNLHWKHVAKIHHGQKLECWSHLSQLSFD